MQISDRLSVIGFFWWYPYRISVHAKIPYQYSSKIRPQSKLTHNQYAEKISVGQRDKLIIVLLLTFGLQWNLSYLDLNYLNTSIFQTAQISHVPCILLTIMKFCLDESTRSKGCCVYLFDGLFILTTTWLLGDNTQGSDH